MTKIIMSAENLAEQIKDTETWQCQVFEKFGLWRSMLSDIASLERSDEDDLPPLQFFFLESAKERLCAAPGAKWTWRTRETVVGGKSLYLEWLKNQWAMGRWENDESIHSSARQFLDPRFSRFESLKYKGGNKIGGRQWSEIVGGYRELVGQEARRHLSDVPLAATKISKSGVEAFVLEYFGKQGWHCRSSASAVGNILAIELPIDEFEYVFRISLSIAGKSLLDHFDGWISITKADVDQRILNGGSAALLAVPLADLFIPISIYYLTHEKERARIASAIFFIDAIAKAVTQIAPSKA
ncbi:hypothetical protein [Rhizobacter sp. SG703]|uniref:hypothetical protein n=1 Tax=Rhizobacter sp. SG703 TaxID=2587140 RepID=UPI0014468BDF|nr:hypothetical protein [Rhizobacter sp. SG703]NKI96967.1 hypothetical protein [Rhizobacter sp. SG703]